MIRKARILATLVVIFLALPIWRAVQVSAVIPVGTIPVLNAPRAIAVNPTTNRVYVAHEDLKVSVIDAVSNTVVSVIDVPGEWSNQDQMGIAVDPVANRVYVSGETAGTVSVIDGSSNVVIDSIPVDNHPRHIEVDPTTNRIYVTSDDGLVVLDGATASVVTTISLGSTKAVSLNAATNRI